MTRARDLAAFVSNADGDVKFDTDTLFIDSSANRVAIGNTAPSRPLHITDNPPIILLEDSGGGSNDKKAQIQVDSGAFEVNARNDDDSSRTDNILVADLGTGNVGIGTNNPQYGRLHIDDGNSDIAMDANGSGQLHIDGNGYGFGVALNASGAQIYTNSASRDLIFGVNETEVARITPQGIAFGGDDASANSLDDYEEGTFTPSYDTSNNDASGQNYGASTLGSYVKIGRVIHFQLTVHLSSITSIGTGTPQIRGLPYSSSGSTPNNQSTRFTVSTYNVNFEGGAGQTVHAYLPTINVAYFQFLTTNDNAPWTVNSTSTFVLGGGTFVTISGHYITN